MRVAKLFVVMALLGAMSLPARAAAGYEIAFSPFLPVRTLVANYRPMREFLERELEEPVTFVSAPDYRTDNLRISRREYAFIVAVANAAYVAHVDHGYVPLLRPAIPTRPALVVRRDSGAIMQDDLASTVIAMPDPLSIVAMQGMQMLREAGLSPTRDVQVVHHGNHAAAVNMVLAGEAAAAIVSDRALLQMPQEVQAQLRAIAVRTKGAAPGVIYLASPDVPAARRERLRQAILRFVNATAEGRALMEKTGYGGLVPATSREIRALKPYGERLRMALRAP